MHGNTLDVVGLPQDATAERMLLGSVMLDAERMHDLRGLLVDGDFATSKHQILWARMCDIYDRGVSVTRETLIDDVRRKKQLESVDGMSYIASLDEGMPRFPVLDGYVRIVKDKSLLRRMMTSGHALVTRCANGVETPQEILDQAIQGILDLAPQGDSGGGWDTAGEIIRQAGGVGPLLNPKTDDSLISWPWPTLQELTCGAHPEQLIILAARPSVGKTSAALQVAYSAAFRKAVAVFSLEMSQNAVVARMVTQVSQVESHKSRHGYLSRDEMQAHTEAHAGIDPLPLYVRKGSSINVPGMHAALRSLRAKAPIGLVVIDYLGLMSPVGRSDNRNTEVGTITRGLKLLAGEFQVPVLLLCQLNRNSSRDNRVPVLTDLRDSGNIEQDADVVIFLHEKSSETSGAAIRDVDMILAKQREGPRDVTVPLHFITGTQTFREITS